MTKLVNRMKRNLCVAMTASLAFGLIGCGSEPQQNETTPTPVPTQEIQVTESPEPTKEPTATPEPTPTEVEEEVRTEFYISAIDEELPSLAEYWKDYFKIGIAVGKSEVAKDITNELIISQFNSMTCGNEMKPDSLLSRQATLDNGSETCPAVDFHNCDGMLSFCQENGIAMRGHTLLWHEQTPDWFFNVGYSNATGAERVTRDVMLERMENYIRLVMEYVNTEYPGVVYAWDVVNEAIAPNEGDPDGLRKKCPWYEVVGPDYIEKAFEYARKYADPEQKLFYNDYNTYDSTKRRAIYNLVTKIQAQGNIDGVGMQSHIGMDSPSVLEYQETIEKFCETGLEVQITELDIGLESNTEEALMKEGSRYKRLFMMFKNIMDNKRANITSITIWGLADNNSWLNKDGKTCYPLLFNRMLETKPAFWGAMLDPGVPLN